MDLTFFPLTLEAVDVRARINGALALRKLMADNVVRRDDVVVVFSTGGNKYSG